MRTGTTSLGKTPATIPNATRTKSRSVPVKSRAKPRTRPRGKFEGFRVLSNSPIRCAIRRVSCSGAHRMKICCVADPSRRSPQRACTARVDVTASRLVGEVSEMARVVESRVTNAYKTLNEELGLPAKPVSPGKFVPPPRLGPRMSRRDPTTGSNTCRTGRRERSHGGRPSSRVRSGLPLQSGEELGYWVTQSDVAETGNVTPTTVRTHHETLEERVA